MQSIVGGNIKIIDSGAYFEIISQNDMPDSLENIEITPGYTFVYDGEKEDNSAHQGIPSASKMDLHEQKEILKLLAEQKRKKKATVSKHSKTPKELHPEFDTLRLPHESPKWFKNSELYKAILKNQTELRQVVHEKLEKYRIDPRYPQTSEKSQSSKSSSVEKKFKKVVTSCLLFNPQFSKGVNTTKPRVKGPSSIPTSFFDWFADWMKYRAVEKCMLGHKSDVEKRVYVIRPKNISLNILKEIRKQLRDAKIYSRTLKRDVQILVEITKVIIQNSKEYREAQEKTIPDILIELIDRTPAHYIQSLCVSLLRDMGNVFAPAKLYELSVPHWFLINQPKDAKKIFDAFDNFGRVINGLDEKVSEEVRAVMQLRDFLSSGDIKKFLVFTTSLAAIVMNKAVAGKKQTRLTTETLDIVVKGGNHMDFSKVVESTGFLNIAKAIRNATIIPLLLKGGSENVDLGWSVHYGLAQDWKKVVRIEKQFVSKLCEFVEKYNRESIKLNTEHKAKRALIKKTDLDEVIKLIEEFGSEIIGMLLIAYGYSRSPKEEKTQTENTNNEEEG